MSFSWFPSSASRCSPLRSAMSTCWLYAASARIAHQRPVAWALQRPVPCQQRASPLRESLPGARSLPTPFLHMYHEAMLLAQAFSGAAPPVSLNALSLTLHLVVVVGSSFLTAAGGSFCGSQRRQRCLPSAVPLCRLGGWSASASARVGVGDLLHWISSSVRGSVSRVRVAVESILVEHDAPGAPSDRPGRL